MPPGFGSGESLHQKRVLVLKAFLPADEQLDVALEILTCHARNVATSGGSIPLKEDLLSSTRSVKLDIGAGTGGNIASSLPKAVQVCRRIFHQASLLWSTGKPRSATCQTEERGLGTESRSSTVPSSSHQPLRLLAHSDTPLTGTALVYGPNGYMKPHYDSATQPNQKEEWLCILSLGLTAVFRCDNEVLHLESGDALVMDSMAVLHGVERVLLDPEVCEEASWRKAGLPFPSRLGLVVWQGRASTSAAGSYGERQIANAMLEGMDALFQDFGEST